MKRPQTGIVIGIAVVSFAVTVLMMYRHRESGAPRAGASQASVWHALLPSAATSLSSAARSAAPPVEAHQPVPGEAAIEVPPSDDTAPPVPVMVAVATHPAPRNDDTGDTGLSTSRQERTVHVLNTSGELLHITVLAVSHIDGKRTVAQVLVPPNQQTDVGSESGLKLEPGYEVTLRSPGHREVTATVQ